MIRAAVLALGLGLWGLSWGLPSRAVLDQVLPPGLDTPQFLEQLSSSWQSMHARLGENLMLNPHSFHDFDGVVRVPAGWTTPPPALVNTARSFHLRSGHEDEQTVLIMLSRLNPLRLQLNPHFFTYGAAYVYSVGATLAAGAAAGLVELRRGLASYLEDPARMAGLYYCGRLLSVFSYAATGLLLVFMGRRWFDEKDGVAAALFFLLTPAAILQAHVLKNHAFWTFWALLTVHFSLEIVEEGGLKSYVKAGIAAGVTVGSFLVGWPACLVIACACLFRIADHRRPAEELQGLALAAAASLGAFLATNPYWLLSWREALAEMKVLGNQGGFSWAHPPMFVAYTLRKALTTPFWALAMTGLAWAAGHRKRDRELFFLACAFACGLAGTLSTTNVKDATYVRYFSGWVPVLCLIAGRAFVEMWSRGAGSRAAAGLCAGVLALHGVTYAYNFRVAASTESTHWRAGRWIEENVAAGSSVGLLRLPQPSNCPYFPFNRYALVFVEVKLFATLPAAELPEYLAVTTPDYDDRPRLEPNLSRYELAATFDRAVLVPGVRVDPSAMSANPRIDVYRLRKG
jgi:hypothetical protein